ncbi:MAG TPA: response regulator [Stellaceae bacterium]|nr:response regulator [Stellaceae bacterium]
MSETAARPVALVVDDDLSYRLFMRQVLDLAGFEVIVESNGRSALDRLAERPVTVLVTDLVMPEIEGLELIELVRNGFPDLRIVAISGGGPQGGSAYLRFARLIGANATLQKPFSGTALIEAVLPAPE